MLHYMLFLFFFFFFLASLTIWMVAHGVWVLPREAVTVCGATLFAYGFGV